MGNLPPEPDPKIKPIRRKKKKPTLPVPDKQPVPEFDHDGSRPGVQAGPSSGAIAWMSLRRLAKFATGAVIGYVVIRTGGSIADALIAAGGYVTGEKMGNEALHKKLGKHTDIDPLVNLLELIKWVINLMRSRKQGGE